MALTALNGSDSKMLSRVAKDWPFPRLLNTVFRLSQSLRIFQGWLSGEKE